MTSNYFPRIAESLQVEQIPISKMVQSIGTPTYFYSHTALTDAYHAFSSAFAPHQPLICFAVKSNSNLAVLNTLAQLGAGFDIVSGGELTRVIKAGGDPRRVVFSGIGKTADEMAFALQQGIFCFNVESEPELALLQEIAHHMNVKAPIAFRINPNIDPQSHPYISTGLKTHKFGIPIEDAIPLYQRAAQHSHIHIRGIACHIGSQITSLNPFESAFQAIFNLAKQLKALSFPITHIDMGGGLGVNYHDEMSPSLTDYANLALKYCSDTTLTLVLEPGRAISALAGILVTQVLYLKSVGEKHFCIVDAGMNDLIRPALYGAYQAISPVVERNTASRCYDVVGPVCESSDYLGKDRVLAVEPGDYLAILGAGAYGFSMSSQYNSRPRAAEVMVKQDHYKVIRPRETIDDLLEKECTFS